MKIKDRKYCTLSFSRDVTVGVTVLECGVLWLHIGHDGREDVRGQESGAGRTASFHTDGDDQPGIDILESGSTV